MEPLLGQLSASVQRLLDQAYQVIRSGRINDPIQIHLRPATYREYCRVWQRLVCFAYRSSRPDKVVRLRRQLNTAQLAALDQMEEYASSREARLQSQLDQACLDLSIVLLDHSLKEDLFDSTLIGFLAVLGVDPTRQMFRDPCQYTTYLSGLDFCDRFSGIIADNAKGDVYFVFSRPDWDEDDPDTINRVWTRIEFPTLVQNIQVTRIIIVHWDTRNNVKLGERTLWPPEGNTTRAVSVNETEPTLTRRTIYADGGFNWMGCGEDPGDPYSSGYHPCCD
ncbi:hypothetical protein BDV12DRAFT_204788 [Aspergillus spectabilis]